MSLNQCLGRISCVDCPFHGKPDCWQNSIVIPFNPEMFSSKCHNLNGKDCRGALASDCVSRMSHKPCPTYTTKQLQEMMK
jgi:hypothetical protein